MDPFPKQSPSAVDNIRFALCCVVLRLTIAPQPQLASENSFHVSTPDISVFCYCAMVAERSGEAGTDASRASRPSLPEPVVTVSAATAPAVEPQLAAPRSAQLPGARADGTIGLWLEKKSPARGKGWQRRWFVINPHKAEMHYFVDGSKEELGDVGGKEPGYVHSKGFLDLSRCHKLTSNNFDSV